MRAIQFTTSEETLQKWNELEALCIDLHEERTEKYTYLIDEFTIALQEVEKYEFIVSEWLKDKVTFDYQPPQNEELI